MCLQRVKRWRGRPEEFFFKIYAHKTDWAWAVGPVYKSLGFNKFTGITLEEGGGVWIRYKGPPSYIPASDGRYYPAGIHAFTEKGFMEVIDPEFVGDLILILYMPDKAYSDGEQIVSKRFAVAGYFILREKGIEVPPAIHFYKIFVDALDGPYTEDAWLLNRTYREDFYYIDSLVREYMDLNPRRIKRFVKPFLKQLKKKLKKRRYK